MEEVGFQDDTHERDLNVSKDEDTTLEMTITKPYLELSAK
jgi:hypothetical protein